MSTAVTTPQYAMDALRQQFIVICVVIVTAVLLLIGILAIVISGIVERCRRRDLEEHLECRVFLTERGGSIVGTISTGPRSSQNAYEHRVGLGYEDMSPTGPGGESVYETVQ